MCPDLMIPQESQEDENLPALNLLICLVARYLPQLISVRSYTAQSMHTKSDLACVLKAAYCPCLFYRYFEQNDLADQPE